jgi:hypothetical protein
MRLSELALAGRTPSLPLTVTLADAAGAADLQLLSLLRVLPGQRYVGAGVWRGRPVLAKLLVGSKAARHFQRELEGVRLLAAQSMTTPLLLADGLKDGEGGWLLSKRRCWPKRWMRSAGYTAKDSGRKICTWTICCATALSCI